MKQSMRIFAACMTALVVCGTGKSDPTELEGARDVLKGIDAMKRLPADGFHVVESQGRLLLVSTNGHYVVTGGRLIDLWNEVEVQRVSDLEKTLRLPLTRMGIRAKELGGFTTGQANAKEAVTVFLDPASAESHKLLPQLRSLMPKYRVDVIFVPAQATRAETSRALICDPNAARAFIEAARVPDATGTGSACGVKELERARVTVHLLGIETLPMSVAPNGVTVAGSPKNYAELIAQNSGS